MSMTPAEIEAERARGRVVSKITFVAALVLVGALVTVATGDRPKNKLNDAENLLFIHAHKSSYLLTTILVAVGVALTTPLIMYLASAVRARREVPRGLPVLAIVGPLLYAVATPLALLIQLPEIKDFADGADHSVAAAKDVLRSSAFGGAEGLSRAGSLALGLALVFISLLAMRTGLLTRFVGIVGIVIGLLTGLFGLQPLLFAVWMGSVAIFAAKPEAAPPAWAAGESVVPDRAPRPAGAPAPRDDETIDVEPK